MTNKKNKLEKLMDSVCLLTLTLGAGEGIGYLLNKMMGGNGIDDIRIGGISAVAGVGVYNGFKKLGKYWSKYWSNKDKEDTDLNNKYKNKEDTEN